MLTYKGKIIKRDKMKVNCKLFSNLIDRSIRLRPQRTREQEHVTLSKAFLHILPRAPSIRARLLTLFVDLRYVVIGQYAMGRSLMDRSTLAKNPSWRREKKEVWDVDGGGKPKGIILRENLANDYQKSDLNHCTSQESHEKKRKKEVWIVDQGGKPWRNIPGKTTLKQLGKDWKPNPYNAPNGMWTGS